MKQEERSNKFTFAFVIILLLISVGLNTWLTLKRTDTFPSKKALIKESKIMHSKLTKAMTELHKYEGIARNIDMIIQKADAKLAEKEKEINKLLRDKKRTTEENLRLQNEIDSLQNSYLTSIDSLLVERQNNLTINARLNQMNETISSLKKQLGYSQQLISENLKIEAKKSSRGEYKQNTTFAKRAEGLFICYDIIQNKVARSGAYNIYTVITSPNGEVIRGANVTEKDVFMHPEYKKMAKYSQVESIKYSNIKENYCHLIIPESVMTPGLYVAEVFTDDNKVGMVTFLLR